MKPYEATEAAYKNGYKKGYEDGKADAVKRGQWHDIYLMTPWVATGICSKCNLKSYINPDFPFAKYCPNCGAKMDGERKDNERKAD